jgi:carbonic anhydrase/acetyltransferase-like protein (isoleucine patch superfamily)
VPVYALGEIEPTIDPTAYVHPDAVIIGNVTLGPESSVWPGAVLRGDGAAITIGARSSIQDGSVLHVTLAHPTKVGAECVIGHLVHLEGCTIEDGALVGMGAIVMNGAKIRKGCVIGAGAIVTEDKEFPENSLILGAPAKAVRTLTAEQVAQLTRGAPSYVRNSKRFKAGLKKIG